MKHITLAAILCAFAFAAVELSAAKDVPTTNPAAVAAPATKPANMPLEAKLILTKDTYTLDTELADKVKAHADKTKTPNRLGDRPPMPPAVEIVFELTNTGTKDVTVPLGGDATSLDLKLEGPGAVTLPYTMMRTMEFRLGKETVIPAGKSLTIPVKKLLHGMRGDSAASYWTQAGEYTLTASYKAPFGGLGDNEQQVTITSAPVKIKVVAPDAKADTTTKPAQGK